MNTLVSDTIELDKICRELKRGPVALDTEFVWKRTYRAKLGIVQFAGQDGQCGALDCVFCTNALPLGDLIADSSVIKILHDARQDLEHLRHYTGANPKNVFDTQLAAVFAGFPAGTGLQKLLSETLGVNLPKTETLTDWTQRPLTDAQLEYALDDVKYMHALRDELIIRMKAAGTFDWFTADSAKYDTPELYKDIDPSDAWLKIKIGKLQLGGAGRAVLKAVAAQREIHAKKWDMPKNWLSDDPSLIGIAVDAAKKGPGAAITAGSCRFAHRMRQHFKRDVLAAEYAKAATEALALPESEWPADTRRIYSGDVLKAADKALEWLRNKSQDIHVDQAAIANRAALTDFIAGGDETNPLASGWRYEVAGRKIEQFAIRNRK